MPVTPRGVNFVALGREPAIPPARIASSAEGLAEVEIFATLQVSGSWMGTQNFEISQSLTVLSRLPETRRVPSEENARDETESQCPTSMATALPVSTFKR